MLLNSVRHLGIVLSLSLLASPSLHADIEIENSDREEDQEKVVLKPRNMLRNPASLPGSTEEDWSYAPTENKFTLGIFASEHLHISKTPTSRATQAVTPDFGTTSHSLPVFGLRAGYSWGTDWSIVAAGAADVEDGVGDPSLGFLVGIPLTGQISSIAGVSVAFPLSTDSRDADRLTKITASWAPLYQGKRFFVGSYTFFTAHFYRSAPEDTTSTALLIEERTEGGGSVYAGYDITNYFSASAGFGLAGAYYTDDSMGWSTEATLARATFTHAGFAASGAFSLVGAATGKAAVPTSPLVGLRLHYVFGDASPIGMGRAESAAYLR